MAKFSDANTLRKEFFRPTMRRRLYASVEALEAGLEAWLHQYNRDWPRLGCRSQGRRKCSVSSASPPRDKEVRKSYQ